MLTTNPFDDDKLREECGIFGVHGAESAAAIVAAILLPPLGLYLARGLGPAFWLDVVLTLVGWIPGMVFALVALFNPRLLARA